MGEFDFDCPTHVSDLSSVSCNDTTEQDFSWFQMVHPLHEPQLLVAPASRRLSVFKLPAKVEAVTSSSSTAGEKLKKIGAKFSVVEGNQSHSNKPELKSTASRVLAPSSGKSDNILPEKRTFGTKIPATVMNSSSFTKRKVEVPLQTLKAKAASSSSLQQQKNKPISKATAIIRKPAVSSVAKREVSRKGEEDDLVALLKKHNEKFTPSVLYEPSRHSVREVRKWEVQSGKVWGSLNPEEREKANNEILEMKKKT